MIKAFEILIWMWNWEAVVTASVSVLFFPFNPNFFFWGQEHKQAGREKGRGGGRHARGNICVGVCMWFLWENHICICICANVDVSLLFLCACSVRLSLSEVRDCLIFLKHCKQARALLTMSLRVNAQNNFQLKIRFSGKSEFHAYYYRINADPHSASARRWDFWQQLQIPFQT